MIYGLAFELGLAHPATLIEDKPTRFGTYVPKNFDEDFHGTVTIREALAQSLNIPAVKVLAAVGPVRLVNRLRRLGSDGGAAEQERGDAGDRARRHRHAALGPRDDLRDAGARRRGGRADASCAGRREPGVRRPVQRGACSRRQPPGTSATSCKDAPPPANAKSGGIAYKTGTSYGFRDAWAVGFDGRHTIAVWVGRPDGAATAGLTGRGAAAPILFDAFARLSNRRAPLAAAPSGVLRVAGASCHRRCGASARAATRTPPGTYLEPPVQIAFPPDRAELESTTTTSGTVVLKAEGGVLPLTWLVDGKPIGSDPARREAELPAASRGFVKLSVIDAKGRADRVTIRLK